MENPLKLEEKEYLLSKYSSLGYSKMAANRRLKQIEAIGAK